MNELLRPVLNLGGLLPVYVLTSCGVLAVFMDAFTPPDKRWRVMAGFGLFGAGVALLLSLLGGTPENTHAFLAKSIYADAPGQMVAMLNLDALARQGSIVIYLGGFLAMLLGIDLARRGRQPMGEYAALMMLGMAGAVFLAASAELLTLFLSVEILSISLYVLTALDRRSKRAGEAAFKYFVLGSFASAIMLMGAAFLFGATGTTYLDDIARAQNVGSYHLMLIGFALLLAGLFFKLALAPFHMYAPDVYDGAPAAVAAVIATAAKTAGFIVLARITITCAHWIVDSRALVESNGAIVSAFEIMFWVVAAISIVWGNIGGVLQKSIKRMLAYSSIAHSGYMLVAILVIFRAAVYGAAEQQALAERALMVYLAGYTVMNLLAFGAASALGKRGEMNIADYAGLSRKQGYTAAGMALAMVSLTGLPPTVGFIGKFLVFATAVEAGFTNLAILAVLASVASAYYYLRVVVTMYMVPKEDGPDLETTPAASGVVLAISAALVLIIGLFPGLLLSRLG